MTLSLAGREPSQRLRTPQSRPILHTFRPSSFLRIFVPAALSVESSNDRFALRASRGPAEQSICSLRSEPTYPLKQRKRPINRNF